MKRGSKILFSLIGILAITAIYTAKTVLDCAYKLKGVKVVSMDQDKIVINVSYYVHNATHLTFLFKSIIGNVMYNDIIISNLNNSQINRYVYKRAISVIDFNVEINNKELITQIWNDFTAGTLAKFRFTVDAVINVDNRSIPFIQDFVLQDLC